MDPGSVGALIGIGVMISVVLWFRVSEMYEKRKTLSKKTPLLKKPIVIVRQHSKMNMILPK